MDRGEMEQRTRRFSLRVIKLCRALPKDVVGRAVASQLVRCGTSVGSNYRASGRGRSKAEFIAKLGIVEGEADECCFWLEIIMEDRILPAKRVKDLHEEATAILSMVAASKISARRGKP